MNIYQNNDLFASLKSNTYPGRGIVLGQTADGKQSVAAYFIMGRSENSRNRVFTERDGEIFTAPFDASKVQDPSLIIYAAVRTFETHLIVTNGNQTDTIYDGLQAGLTFSRALESRCFEPDAPNYTPRISGLISFMENGFTYQMSILKSADPEGSACNRFTFAYAPIPGLGHFLHTYAGDGNPLPTFQGEPERIALADGIDEMTDRLWTSLNAENRISLYVRYTDLKTGTAEKRIVNKHQWS